MKEILNQNQYNQHQYSDTVFALIASFIAGLFLVSLIVLSKMPSGLNLPSYTPETYQHKSAASSVIVIKPSRPIVSPPVQVQQQPIYPADLESLRHRNLLLPVPGIDRSALRDTFYETRGSTRIHEAIDILAPRNTPVLAVEDGTIARLWYSDNGGNTIYEFDPTQTYAYYYAHLEGYASGLKEGDHIRKGEVIGYVGTSGNAPKDTPHLHFTIFKLTPEKHWWQGTAINPYDIFKG